jgi:uncharacterized protein (DUF433 family)
MATADLIQDRGPEIAGTRITVYNLLPYFLDPTATEDYIGRLYDLMPEQVAAARAYVLHNIDTVLDQHLKIEARIAAGNPPEVIEQAKLTRARFQKFREWLAERDRTAAKESTAEIAARNGFPTFQEWLAQGDSRPTVDS